MEFTTIRRAVKAFVTDSSDLDRNPDLVNASGTVTFVPSLVSGDVIQDIDENGRPVSIALAPIEADILDGIIYHEGEEGIQLVAGGPNSNPSVIRWKAGFKNMKAGSFSFDLKPVTFDAIPGGEVDLTLVAPLAGTSSTIVRGATGTSLHDITLEGAELVVTVSDDAGVRELRRIPLENIQRAEDAAQRSETAAATAEAAAREAATLVSGFDISFTEDPPGSGLYTVPTAGFAPDPANPGLYLIGA